MNDSINHFNHFNHFKKKHELKWGRHGGFGGPISNPSNSILSTDTDQYNDTDDRYQITDHYNEKGHEWVTEKINNFIRKYVGKNKVVYYLLCTQDNQYIKKIRVSKVFIENGKYFLKIKKLD